MTVKAGSSTTLLAIPSADKSVVLSPKGGSAGGDGIFVQWRC
jgi:hypothetical protein